MRISKLFFLFVLLFSFLLSCSGFVRKIPKKMPDDFTLEYYDGGGMSPESDRYFISKDSCYVELNREMIINRFRFMISPEELETIYNTVYENKFENIKTRNVQTYDRGGITISIHASGNTVSVHDAGSDYIEESWNANFSNILNAVYAVTVPEIERNKSPIVIRFDSSIMSSGLYAGLSIEEFYMNSDSSKNGREIYGFLKGRHPFHVYLMEHTMPVYNRKLVSSTDSMLNICGDHDSLLIAWKDSMIIVNKRPECDPDKPGKK